MDGRTLAIRTPMLSPPYVCERNTLVSFFFIKKINKHPRELSAGRSALAEQKGSRKRTRWSGGGGGEVTFLFDSAVSLCCLAIEPDRQSRSLAWVRHGSDPPASAPPVASCRVSRWHGALTMPPVGCRRCLICLVCSSRIVNVCRAWTADARRPVGVRGNVGARRHTRGQNVCLGHGTEVCIGVKMGGSIGWQRTVSSG